MLNDPWGNEKAGFTVTGKINRADWGLVWNTAIESGGVLVADEIEITCEVELTKVGQKFLEIELKSPVESISVLHKYTDQKAQLTLEKKIQKIEK